MNTNLSERKVKNQFCKYCGGKIDPHTKQCVQCGKKRFNMPKVSPLAIVILCVLAAVAGLNIYQKVQYSQEYVSYQSTIAELSNVNDSTSADIAEYKKVTAYYAKGNFDYLKVLANYESELARAEEYIAVSDGVIRTYKCPYLKSADKRYLYDSHEALSLGFPRCACATCAEFGYHYSF